MHVGYDSKNIEMLLTTNSELHFKKVRRDGGVAVTPDSEYRPDRIFGADAYMKLSMIAASIDSPYMLVRGAIFAKPNRNSLNQELVDMDEDFSI